MGASFRKVEQIIQLAGCDLLTISPELLAELPNTEGELDAGADARDGRSASDEPAHHLDEKTYRWLHNEDADGGREADATASASSTPTRASSSTGRAPSRPRPDAGAAFGRSRRRQVATGGPRVTVGRFVHRPGRPAGIRYNAPKFQ